MALKNGQSCGPCLIPVAAVLLGCGFFFSACSPAQSNDSHDTQEAESIAVPGLLASFEYGIHEEATKKDGTYTVQRIDARPLLESTAGSSSAELLRDAKSVQWNGQMLFRESGVFRFHAMVCGQLLITVDDYVVLKTAVEAESFVSGDAVTLESGEHTLQIRLSRHGVNPPASLQVFWSSETFTLEPLPADVLTCAGEEADRVSVLQRGTNLAEALRCAACHQVPAGLSPPPAPSLERLRDRLMVDALRRHLSSVGGSAEDSLMPRFDLNEQEIDSIAAYLHSAAEEPFTDSPPEFKPDDAVHGHALLRSVGCAACHKLPGQPLPEEPAADVDPELVPHSVVLSGNGRPGHSGPSLQTVGDRRHSSWLLRWLQSPESLDVTHRMPVFDISDDERRMIVAALSGSKQSVTSEPSSDQTSADAVNSSKNSVNSSLDSPEQIATGRQLIVSAGCAACHRVRDLDAGRQGIALSLLQADKLLPANRPENPETVTSDADCLRTAAESRVSTGVKSSSGMRRVPRFEMSDDQRIALRKWYSDVRALNALRILETDKSPSSSGSEGLQLSSFERGRRLMTRHGCLSCHDRDQQRGISLQAKQLSESHAELSGHSQALIPPSLTAVGDKLDDEYLQDIISGKKSSRRLPWLTVRMPRFRLPASEVRDLVRYLTVADRIPDEADGVRPEIAAASLPATASTDELLTGNKLTGAAGFNCVACHAAGAFEPRNVALGTRGSDLLTMGARLRSRFFHRWMKNPIRVIPGIEMPAIRRAVPGVPGESLQEQMTVIWRAVSDSRFTAPTVTSRYEQYLTVAPGDPPRIIRDVFTVGEERRSRSVARALAVGLNNSHSLLIDLDTMQLQQWTVGEFARQRTQGKSWFWSLAGVTAGQFRPATGNDTDSQGTSGNDNADSDKGREIASDFLEYRLVPSTAELSDLGLPPTEDEGRFAELVSYKVISSTESLESEPGGQVEWTWRMYFSTAGSKMSNELKLRDTAGVSSNLPDASDPHSPVTAWTDPQRPVQSILIRESVSSFSEDNRTGFVRKLTPVQLPANMLLQIAPLDIEFSDDLDASVSDFRKVRLGTGQSFFRRYTVGAAVPAVVPAAVPELITSVQDVTTVPGYRGVRLPISTNIMPTAMAFLPDGRLVFTSLRGQVWTASDTNGDGLEDQLTLFEEGLAAPFGILADSDSVIVAHKPELIRLRDTNGDGRADERTVVASGWGYSDDYHDWTTGLLRDSERNLYVGLGSDYSQKDRSRQHDRWRGTILKIDPSGVPTPLASAFRYPMSLAMDSSQRLFATDNQGVQNTFNEINHVVPGGRYGVPSRHAPADVLTDLPSKQDKPKTVASDGIGSDGTGSDGTVQGNAGSDQGVIHQTPSVQIPHPWTRSVNSILFLPESFSAVGMQGHGIGCEYDLRFLIRWTVQEVDGTLQGAVYPFSLPDQAAGGSNLIGPISSAVSPDGQLVIGCIWDSGWQGGTNTGAITRLKPDRLPHNGIREVQATADGFRIDFFRPVAEAAATDLSGYRIGGYTRIWAGSYATPNADEHQREATSVHLSADRRSVRLKVPGLKAGYLYDIAIAGALLQSESFWPAEAHYTLRKIPTDRSARP